MKKMLLSALLAWCFIISGAHAYDVSGFTPDDYVVYKTIDGSELKLEVFYPEGHNPTDSTPAIVFFFGGGWSSGSPSEFHPHCEYLAERGMVAMSAEYRVSSTYGTTPQECVMDGKSAIRWLRNNGGSLGIDTNMVAAGGGSAGGHVAAATAALPGFNEAGEDLTISCIPDALVLFNPVVDNGPGGYGYDRVQAYWEVFSPLHNLHAGMPPTSFYLGTNDKFVPVSTAQAYQTGMQSFGLRCDLHLYEGRPHGFFNYYEPDYAETVAEMDRFLVSLGFLEEAPTKLIAVGGDNSVSLNWDDSVSGNLAGYNVYRSTTSGSYGSALVAGLVSSEYTDPTAVNGTTYHYVVTAVDTNANESAQSVEVSATPEYVPDVNLNDEFDFGTDPGKVTATAAGFTHFVAGGQTITDVADASRFISAIGSGPNDFAILKPYNDLGGSKADFNITMEAELVTSSDGEPLRSRYGIAMFNNSSDLHETGIDALIYYHNGNINMYIRNGLDGAILAEQLFKNIGGSEKYTFEVTGAYSGTDLDLVFSVTDGTITKTLNLTVNPESYPGTLFGCATRMRNGFAVDFDRLTIVAGSALGAPDAPTGLAAIADDGSVSLDWDDNAESDLAGYNVYRSIVPGNYGVALATGLVASAHVDGTVGNGTIYYYAVTALNTNGNESARSSEVFAIPAAAGNHPPAFTSDPVVETNAQERAAYGATLADNASDPESDAMLFSKVSGPTWLSVAFDGSLSGTPGSADTGLNSFTVQVDAAGGSDTATLEITVDADTTPAGLAVVFGSNNDGLGGFSTSTPDPAQESWSIESNSVLYINDDPDGAPDIGAEGGTRNGSLLRAVPLDRTAGSSFTFEGSLISPPATATTTTGLAWFSLVMELERGCLWKSIRIIIKTGSIWLMVLVQLRQLARV